MFFSKGSRLSARVFGTVLNYPLYDGNCCQAARESLAVGDVAGAIAEWRRIADLGSGTARCIIAYLYLLGAPSIPKDLEEARRMALSAVSGARGYANYLLGCISLHEKRTSDSAKYFRESIKAGFTPAATHLASLAAHGPNEEGKRKAVDLLRKSVLARHWPAFVRLAGVYLSGQLGFANRVIGLLLLAPAFLTLSLALKYRIFSIESFQVFSDTSKPLFNEDGIQRAGAAVSVAPGIFRRNVLRWVHAAAGTTAVSVLLSHSMDGRNGNLSALMLGTWALLAACPYAISYMIASNLNARTLISMLVQVMGVWVLTMFVCSAYSGQMFNARLDTWDVVQTAAAEAWLLVAACGLG